LLFFPLMSLWCVLAPEQFLFFAMLKTTIKEKVYPPPPLLLFRPGFCPFLRAVKRLTTVVELLIRKQLRSTLHPNLLFLLYNFKKVPVRKGRMINKKHKLWIQLRFLVREKKRCNFAVLSICRLHILDKMTENQNSSGQQ